MNDLSNLVLHNPKNDKVLKFLKLIDKNELIYSFRTWKKILFRI